MTDADPDDLSALDPWLRRERARGAPAGFPDRVMAGIAARARPRQVPCWLEVAAVLLAAPVLFARLVGLVLVFLP